MWRIFGASSSSLIIDITQPAVKQAIVALHGARAEKEKSFEENKTQLK